MTPYKSATFDTTSNAWDAGSTTFSVTRHEAGFDLDQAHGIHQITLIGLDGGTFSLKVLLPGEQDWRDYNTDPNDEGAILVIDEIIVQGVRAVLANLGAGAAPKLTLTSRLRGL